MKYLVLALILFTLATTAMAQASVATLNPPDIEVLKLSWSRFQYREGSDNVAFPMDSRKQVIQDRVTRPPEARRPQSSGAGPPDQTPRKIVTAPVFNPEGALVKGFFYNATIKNSGTKTIKALDWDYVFFEPGTEVVLSRTSFTYVGKINPGKEKKLSQFTTSPPAQVVTVKGIENNPNKPFTERVVIIRIEYTDGSLWVRPEQE